MSKRKGYLLLDAAISLTLLSILSITIFTFYNSYTIMKRNNLLKVNCMEKFKAITMEANYNVSFNEFDQLEKEKRYNINARSIDDIISNQLIDLLDDEESLGDESCSLSVLPSNNNNELLVEINYFKQQGNFKYTNSEVVRKYSFIK